MKILGLVFAIESSAINLMLKLRQTLVWLVVFLEIQTRLSGIFKQHLLFKKANDILRKEESHLKFGLNYLLVGYLQFAEASFIKGIAMAIENKLYNTFALLYHRNYKVIIKSKDFLIAKEFSNKALSISHYLDDKLTIVDIDKVRGLIS